MKRLKFLPLILSLCILFAGCDSVVSSQPAADLGNTVTMLDVGQASAAVIESGGQVCVIDAGKAGGGSDTVTYLYERKVEKVDLLVLTHFHYDHTSQALEIIRNFEIGTVLIPTLTDENVPDTYFYKSLLEDSANGYYNLVYAQKGRTFIIGEGVLTVADDTYNSENINNTSTVTVFTLGDFTYVNMGDTETDRDYYLLDLLPEDIDFLTAGHHGSKDSTSEILLDRLKPDLVGISCSENNDYGHPHAQLLKRLADRNIPYVITCEYGDIVYDIDTKQLVKQ